MATPRFRVEQTDEGSVLVHRQNSDHTVEARRTVVHVTIEARVVRVCRSLIPGGLERWLRLDINDVSFGSEADYSDLSVWLEDEDDRYEAENKIFGINGDDLWDLEVTNARVVSLEARSRSGHPYLNRAVEPGEGGNNEDQGPTADLWYHTGDDDSGYHWLALVLTVGFPEPRFRELIDACESGRADTLVLQCSCRAWSTGWAFQSARDLVLSAGETVTLNIDEATMSAPFPAHTTASSAREKVSGRENGSVDEERALEQAETLSVPDTSVGRGIMVLLATVGVCVVAALLGAGAIAVLTIAILGGTAALVTTLRSIGSAFLGRFTLRSKVKAKRGTSPGQ